MKKAIVYLTIILAAFLFNVNNAHIIYSAEEKQHHDDELSIMQHGEISAGGKAHLDIALSGPAKAPKALRLWVGNKSAKGSMKARAGKGHSPGEYHVEVEVPEKMPENSKLWVEIQDSDGRKKSSFDLK